MGTGMKVFLWILGIIVILVGLLVGAGIYLAKGAGDSMAEGTKFGEAVEKAECLEEIAQRTSECDGVGCVINASLFGSTCLRAGQGEPADVCPTDVSPREQARQYCSTHGESEYCVDVLEGIVDGYCSDPDAEISFGFE